jgi:ABC-type transport system substrate-binding protein
VLHSENGYAGRVCGTPELDALIEKGRAETDPAVRHNIYREIERHIRNEALLLPLFHEQSYVFTRPEWEGMRLSLFPPNISYQSMRLREGAGP